MKAIELKIELIKKGWTQKDAATALGIHQVYMNQLCNGRRKSRRTAMRIMLLPPYKNISNLRGGAHNENTGR